MSKRVIHNWIIPEIRNLNNLRIQYYQTQVNLKLSEINDPESKANVINDLKQLDEIYLQLKSEIIRSGYANSDIILEAMIKNQKTKTEILENILNKQNQIKNENITL
jgi:hypothetical protein